MAIASAASALEVGDPVAASTFLALVDEDRVTWEVQYLRAQLDRSVARLYLDEPIRAAFVTSSSSAASAP